jgi:hypothetical protein
MVQFLSIIFFLFLQFLLGFSKVPVFCVTLYLYATGGISDCVNRLLHQILGCVPAIILIIFIFVK